MAWAIVKERIKLIEIVGIVFSFAGVVMIGYSKQQRINASNADTVVEEAEEESS